MSKHSKLVVKYESDVFRSNKVPLNPIGMEIIAVPEDRGMALVCNSEQTAFLLAEDFDVEVISPNNFCERFAIFAPLGSMEDKGRTALLKCLRANYNVTEQGGVPWHFMHIR